jgi:hypothetical protein
VSVDLEALRTNREALLLAEVAAWLHDMGKCADAFFQPDGIGFDATSCQGNPRVNPHKAVYPPVELPLRPYWGSLSPSRGQCSRLEEAQHATALWQTFVKLHVNANLLDFRVTLTLPDGSSLGSTEGRELILWGRPLVSDQFSNFQRILGTLAIPAAYLGRAHGAAHIEKEESPESGSSAISTPFGFEYGEIKKQDEKLERVLSLLRSQLSSRYNRQDFLKNLEVNFSLALGDSRRPENEITLWSWSSIVAALYKAAVAGTLLGYKPAPSDIKWRLLSVKTTKSFVYSQTSRIPDLLARRKILADAFERVRLLLEETYPLGTQVYQGENNGLYVVPNLADLLELPDKHGVTLRELIHAEFSKGTLKGPKNSERVSISGETVSALQLDSREWWGQRPSKNHMDEVPPIAEILQDEASTSADPQQVTSWWTNRQGDICSVCGLRPQGPSPKSLTRKVCDVCEQRREDRSIEWAKKLDTTIWIDEVADIHSRLALVVGQFAIEDWLKPDGMIKTLLVKPLTAGSSAATNPPTKTVSFARLQRVWETTRLFWEQIASSLDEQVGKVSLRLRIEAEYSSSAQSDTLGVSHSYEIRVENQRLSIVCDQKDKFLTAENLQYLAKLLNAPEENQKSYDSAAMFVRDVLLKKGEFPIEEPTGYGNPNKLRGKLKIKSVTPEATPYVPAITILAEPRNFMALVPANKALKVVEAIKAKYEIEMGKVRNRLPLTVGVVFAGSRTPLAALLDAGRRMLKFKSEEKKWKVINATDDSFKTGVDNAGNEVRTSSRRLDLESDDTIPKKITWHIPNKMGDGSEDHWYPYFFTEAAPDGTRRMFQSSDGSRQLIHVGDLRNTDEVIVQPSTFDFEFLDSAAQRFEISYKDGKRRGWERRARPYYLEEIEDFQKIWKTLEEGLATSQIKTLGELIETKRREWFDESALLDDEQRKQRDKTFERFVKDATTNAAWKKGKRPEVKDEDKKPTFIVQAALRGQLADVIELFMQILKQKSKVDGKDKL